MSSNAVARRSQPRNARTCPNDVEYRCTSRIVSQSHEQAQCFVLHYGMYSGACHDIGELVLVDAELLGELDELD
jgi:hypothetical protein